MLSPGEISARWGWGEFSALLAPTWAGPRALAGRGSRPPGYLSVFGAPWGEVEVPLLVGAGGVESEAVEEGWGQGPGPRPILKHLLEASAELNQEAMAAVAAGVCLLPSGP